jgi:hypothetical protein
LQQQKHDDRGKLTADQGDVLETRIEAAMVGVGDLAEIGRTGTVFAAEAETLDDPRQRQNDRRGKPDRGVGGRGRDNQRAETHADDRQRQRDPPAITVGNEAEQPAAQRTHQERGGEQHGSIELLHHGIAVWKECGRKVQRERRIGVEIVPFDQIADRADEDRLDPAFDVEDIEMLAPGLYGFNGHLIS